MTRLPLLVLFCPVIALQAQPEGLWQGFDGEWGHVSRQLVALAEATPAETFRWRPVEGVRTTAEIYTHLVQANFGLLAYTGPKMPPEVADRKFGATTGKAEIITWLKRSLEAVKTARAALKPGDLERVVKISGREGTVEGMYLRIIVHANEHMGQLIAYARSSDVKPPWSEK